MAKTNPKFEFQKVFQIDANELIDARRKAQLIHHTSDIDAAGAEVEMTARKVLRRRLPTSYYVSHGHIIDYDFNSSGQFDIIIADNTASPILFKAENKTEYFPHESIYAIGEVRSSFSNPDEITEFMDKVAFVKYLRSANKMPLNKITPKISLGNGLNTDYKGPWTYRNPLFSFMLFVNSPNTDFPKLANKLRKTYSSTPEELLPDIVCILDKGVIVNAQLITTETTMEMGNINIVVEFNDPSKTNKWIFLSYGDNEHREGGNFSVLVLFILEVLRNSMLSLPNFLKYVQEVATPANSSTDFEILSGD